LLPLVALNLVFRSPWFQKIAAFIFNSATASRRKIEKKHVATPASTLQQKAVSHPDLPSKGDLKPNSCRLAPT
jgi:hypothetical protein